MRHRVTGLALASLIGSTLAAMVLAATPSLAGAQTTTGYIEICKTFTAAGPSFRAIAKRYASDPNAQSELETTVRNGSTGAWGPTPMPGVDVPERDLKRLVAFILSLKEY